MLLQQHQSSNWLGIMKEYSKNCNELIKIKNSKTSEINFAGEYNLIN